MRGVCISTALSVALLIAGSDKSQAQYVPSKPFVDHILSMQITRQNGAQRARLAIGAIPTTSDVSAGPLYNAATGIGPDRGLTRDIRDAQIYKTAAPAVVLIATKDGIGSGSLIAGDGTILTNAHVVRGYSKVGVLFKPQQEGAKPRPDDIIIADVVKMDLARDLALVRVPSKPAQVVPLKLGDMSGVAVGEDVHAIGHPTGEAWSYTKGIISQIRRSYVWMDDNGKHEATVIQTQTPISPGNSGGPLIDDQGALIGVNSFKLLDSENLNFAVSVDDVQSFLNEPATIPNPATRTSKPKCEVKTLYDGESKDKTADVTVYDANCTGKPSAILILPHNPSDPMMLAIFDGDPSRSYRIYFDASRTGKWETSLWRDNPTGPWQLMCFHQNGNIEPARCEPYDPATASN